jgi:regulatory protein
VRRDLAQKGLKAELIEETMDARYGETNEETLARQHLDRKRIKKPENERETARVVRRLVAAGFSTGTIMRILRQWDVPEETVAAVEGMEAEAGEE